MASVNKVLLIGNLTRDPELRYAPSGAAIVKFGMAMNHVFTDKGGERHESTCFVDITAFGRTAENCNQYLKKGRQVFVEGRLEYSTWENKEGDKRSKHEVVAERVQFLGSARDNDGEGGGGGGGEGSSRGERSGGGSRGGASRGGGRAYAPRGGGGDAGGGGDDIPLDDIPF